LAGAVLHGIENSPGVSETPSVRLAHPEEREQAQALQQAAFGSTTLALPHPGHRDEPRVVTRDGRVVSCLTLLYAELSVHGAAVPMGGIRHVATHPDEQNQGYASLLLRDTLRDQYRQGLPLSALFPFSFRYYRKLGYELAGNHCHFWCRPNCLPAYAERSRCRPAAADDDAALARFHSRRLGSLACGLTRSAERWRELRMEPSLSIVVCREAEVEGCLVTTEARDAYGGKVLRVLEMAADTPRGWRALLGTLSQFGGESVEWLAAASDIAASGILRSPAPLREGFKPRGIVTVRPMFQLRIVDLKAALRCRLLAFPGGAYALALRLRDDLLPENAQPITLEADAQGVRLRPAQPADSWLEADVQVFAQIYCGYLSPSEAVSQGLAHASAPDAVELAEALFPPGETFISELDRF
jgi:predicted acetyltransferase